MLNASGLLRKTRLIELTSLINDGIIVTMVTFNYRILHLALL